MNQRADFIIPECYIDTNLVETLACHGGCNHQKGCNQVAKIMQEKFTDKFAVGIIDADKRRPTYLNEFNEISESPHLRLFRHRLRPHFLILIQPATDGFILSCAEDASLSLKDYQLSSNMKEFTTQTKNTLSNKDLRFKRLFRDLLSQPEMKMLQSLLEYLIVNTYRSSDDELKRILFK